MECFTQPKYRLHNKEGFVLIPPQALNNGWHRIDIQQIFAKLDSPENLSDPGIKPTSLVSPELADGFFTTEPPGKPVKTPTPNSSNFDQRLKAKVFLIWRFILSGDWSL